MNKTKIPFYQERLESFETELKITEKQHAKTSALRLLTFLAILLSWLYVITLNISVGITCGISSIIVFAILLKRHKKLDDRKLFLKTIISINKNEIASCQGDYSAFGSGEDYIDHSHPYAYDIDLYGKGSLFQYLNRTVTIKGRDLLSKWLGNSPLKNEQILQNQEAVKELATLSDFRQEFQTKGGLFKSLSDEETLVKSWLSEKPFFKRRIPTLLILILAPATNLSILGMVIFGVLSWDALIYMVIISLLIVGSRVRSFNVYYDILSKSHQVLKTMARLIQVIENQTFKDKHLAALKAQLIRNNASASIQITQLTKLLNQLDNRNNILLAVILNTLFYWDWHYLFRIEKWQKNHKIEFTHWLDTIANMDALISLANLSFNNDDFNYPTLASKEFELKAEALGHPLLSQEKRVCNNFSIGEEPRYAIVTGANMAGKSTFLRTIASNLVLAGCGAPVCANKMSYFPLKMHSSMRAEDSLMQGESYFFAELKRLQKITHELDKGEKLFIILDEILRGTNSEDKRKGSIGFIEKITEKLAYGIVATHDLELARLAEQRPDTFKALCFEVAIENNQLNFDYKLSPGVTKNMNASFLMKNMGIID